MKIVFMGTPRAAAVSLERLIDDGHDIVAVYTQPDRPSGRGKKVAFSAVKDVALVNGLSLLQPSRIKTDEALAVFRSHKADAAVVVAYGRILPEGFLNCFPHGALNVHFSLLPKYRGAAPVNWAIVNGETETGVTTIKMDTGLDTGGILLKKAAPIGVHENAVELMDRLSILGADLISETVSNFNELHAVPQNDADATLAPMMVKEDGLIDWHRSAAEIERRIRGFQPFPSSYTFYRSGRLTIWKAEKAETASSTGVPGQVVNAGGDDLYVACGHSTYLKLEEVQPEGKRRMSVRDFLNGSKIRVGDIFFNSQILAAQYMSQ